MILLRYLLVTRLFGYQPRILGSSTKRASDSSPSPSGDPPAGSNRRRQGKVGLAMWLTIRCAGAFSVMKATLPISVPQCGQVVGSVA